MDKRITRALAAGTFLTLPLLAACGTSTAPSGTSAAPSATSAATSAASSAAPSSSAAATPSASSSPTTTTDPAQDKAAVAKASTKFVKAALTIGYPDKSFDDYLDHLKPVMTKDGYQSVESAKGQNEKDAKGLYNAHARSVAKIKGDVKVTAISADSATSKVAYQSLIQKQQGGGWTTLKTAKKQTVTIQLLKTDGKWLVDDAK